MSSSVTMGEARELYGTLQECANLLDRIESKSRLTEREVAAVLTVLTATLGLLRRANLGEEHNEIIMKIQKIVTLLIVLKTQFAATYATMGPLGWALAGVGAMGVVFTIDDVMTCNRF